MADTHHEFERSEVFPSYFVNALQRFLSSEITNLALRRVNFTTVEVVPASGEGVAGIAIEGNMRYVEAAVQRAHPGGAAGTYSVFVTASEDDISPAPDPYTDNTDYAFALSIEAPGEEPDIVPGVVDVYRKIGEVDWTGVGGMISAVRQTVGRVTGAMLADGAITGEYDIFGFPQVGPLEVARLQDGALFLDIRENGINPDVHLPNLGVGFAKLAGLPVVKLTESTSNLNIPNNALTRVNFTAESGKDVYEGEGELGWSGDIDFITGTGSIVVAFASFAFAANATGVRRIELQMGGVTVKSKEVPSAGASVPTHLDLWWIGAKTGDISIAAFQNSGGNLSLLGAAATPIEMGVIAINTP